MLKFRRPSTTGAPHYESKTKPPRVCWCLACRTKCRKHPEHLVQAARRAVTSMPHFQSKPAEIPVKRPTYPPEGLSPTLRKLARRAERRCVRRARDARRKREGKFNRHHRQQPQKRLLRPDSRQAVDPLNVMAEFYQKKKEEMPLKNTHLVLWKIEKRNGLPDLSTDEEITNVKRWRRRWRLLERQRKNIVLNSPFNLTQKPIDMGPYPTYPTPRTPHGSLSASLWAVDPPANTPDLSVDTASATL